MVIADNSLIVEAMSIGLRESGDFNLIGYVAADGVAVEAVVSERPDAVLVDDMDDGDQALSLIREIKTAVPAVSVIVLAFAMEQSWMDAVFDAGASAVISKGTHPMSLTTLIRETLDQHVLHVPPRDVEDANFRPQLVGDEENALTSRELEVLKLVAAGLSNREIAQKLWVTEQTIKFHLANVYRKLDVGNRTQASHYAHTNGLVDSRSVLVAP
jgi:DNA-binding NarL/FixJ family response regulator